MKFSLITPLVASAALVSAVPIRVIVVSSTHNVAQPISGHAGHVTGGDNKVAQLMEPPQQLEEMFPDAKWLTPPQLSHHAAEGDADKKSHQAHGGRPCPMKGNMHSKLVDISNAFRGTFGLPLIEMGHKMEGKMHGGMIQVTKFVGKPGEMHGLPPHMMMGHPHGHHHGMKVHGHHRGTTFGERIQVALLSLGPWEGRAVAFVLGCGLGVLIRMFFVLAVVTFRGIKGRKESEEEQEAEYTVIYEYQGDAEELAVPPPNYNYPVDEKAALEESK